MVDLSIAYRHPLRYSELEDAVCFWRIIHDPRSVVVEGAKEPLVYPYSLYIPYWKRKPFEATN